MSHCKNSHDERDDMKVNVPYSNKNQKVDDMDIDETANNDTS